MTIHDSKATMLPPSQVAFVIDSNRPVLTHRRSMHAETGMQPHSHPRGQLLWAANGILKLTTPNTVWVIPSTHAVWIPSNVIHQVHSETSTQMRNLYIDPSHAPRNGSTSVSMLKMTSLMREVVLSMTSSRLQNSEQALTHLGLVAIDELDTLEEFPFYLPAGEDPRLSKLISYIINEPTQSTSLKELSVRVGASARTIERLFKSQTGMTYRQWRSRYKLMGSLEFIRQGYGTSQVAYELGYSSVSSFISAFKEFLGCTPQEYARQNGANLA